MKIIYMEEKKMNNQEFDLVKKAYIHALSEVKSAMRFYQIKIKVGKGIKIKAPIPESFIIKIIYFAISSFNYGSEELIDEEEFLEDKDYKIYLEDIE